MSSTRLQHVVSVALLGFSIAIPGIAVGALPHGDDELDRRIDDATARVDRVHPSRVSSGWSLSSANGAHGTGAPSASLGGRRSKGWSFGFTPVFWAPAMDGSLTIDDRTIDIDSSITDGLETTFENFEFATMGRFEANHCKWSLILDFFYVGIGNETDVDVGATQVDVEWEQDTLILEGLVGYRIAELPLGCGRGCFQPSLAIDALAGARFYYMSGDIELQPGPDVSGSESWIDPVVGARAVFSVTPSLMFTFHGDIGGFGVGSDLSWRLGAALRWKIAQCVSLDAGWAVIDTDYEDGSFAYDVTLSGPFLGATFRF